MADMEEYFGKEILAQIDTAYRNQKNQHWFRICIPSAVFDVPLPRHLALSQFLFGSASKFWEYAAQIAEREKKPVVVTNSLSSKHSTAKRSEVFKQSESDTMVTKLEKGSESVCAQIEKILCDNIGWTEANLWMTYPGLMKRLLRDRADGVNWLKTLLETIKTTAKEKHLLQESKYHSEDMQWTQAFTNTAINLYTSTDKPKKISRNLLMREAGWKKLNIPDPRKFPIARQQLELLKESTWHFYARRILWSKLRLNEIGSSSRDALGPSGIEHHQGSLVLNYFSSVPSNRILRPGAIMQILTEHKIPKEWEGPVSGISFLRPGRNSSCGGQLYE